MRINTNDLCVTCLSTDRRLVALQKITMLIQEINLFEVKESSGGVCWECWSMILKYQRFKTRAQKAQETLHEINDQHNIKSLSTLSCYTNHQDNHLTINNDPLNNTDININEDVKNEKTIFIKEEYDDSNDNTSYTEVEDTEINKLITENNDVSCDYMSKIEAEVTDISKLTTDTKITEIKHNNLSKEKINKKTLHKVKIKKIDPVKIDEKEIKEKFVEVKLTHEEIINSREEKRNHHNYKKLPFKCDSCVLGFTREDTYNLHMEKKHNEKVGEHMCNICSIRFFSKLAQNNHECKHYMCYRCKFCKYETHEFSQAINHCKTKHEADKQDSIHCSQCDAVVKTPEDLEKHNQTEHTLQCNECGGAFKGRGSLRKHKIRIHTVKREFICDICKKTFKTKTRLETHMVGHNSTIAKNLTYCQLCKIQYKNIFVYRMHLKYSANHSERYSCPECNKKFASEVYLKRHYNFFHLQKSKFNCEICNKLFISHWKLKHHKQMYHGLSRPREHACNTCEKKFFTKPSLRSHELTHSEHRGYMCEDCGDTFKQSAALYTHCRLVHRGGRRKRKR